LLIIIFILSILFILSKYLLDLHPDYFGIVCNLVEEFISLRPMGR